MSVRAVEGKLPYTGGKAIEITEDKVINLRLRDENNLIIWDEGDNEIYVDLQLPNEITPTDAFPVGITTGRVIIDNGWDSTGTLICAKTTSGDNIKVFYADDGKLYVDNGTGLFTQVYLKPEVDALLQQLRTYVDTELAKKQDKLIAGDNIEIASDGKTISAILPPLSRFLSLWDCSTGEPISFPASTPFEYETGDHYLVNTVDNTTNYRPDGTEWDGVASTTVETSVVGEGDMYIYDGIRWLLQHNQPGGGGSVISVNSQTGVVVLDADDISDSTTTNKFVTASDKTTWDGKVAVSTDTGNELSSGTKIWLGTTADFSSIVTKDSNTMYIQYVSDGVVYQEVEYIQSDADAYIDTGYKPNNTTRYVVDYQSLSAGVAPIGCYNNPANYGQIIVTEGYGYVIAAHYGTTYASNFGDCSSRVESDLNGNVFSVNGIVKHTFTANTFTMNINARLFGFNRDGIRSNPGPMKLWSAKIYDNGTLVRDFMPCYRISDGVIGLYDKVNDVFYTNAGSGAFTKGPDVN